MSITGWMRQGWFGVFCSRIPSWVDIYFGQLEYSAEAFIYRAAR